MKLQKHSIQYATIFLLVLLISCTVRIIAPYDDVTDTKITELHGKIVMQLSKWNRISKSDPASDKLTHANNIDFYDEVYTVLDILVLRNTAIEQNKIINQQLANAKGIISDMETLHMTNNGRGMNTATIDLTRRNIEMAFGAIQKMEMELKKGIVK